ncbi:MAG: molecular chaperone Hsp90 [Bacillota bacterium]|nr:molecular chaperone Hsp90 [Bacillota bacterium]
MKQDVLNYVIEKTKALMEAPTCSPETKEAAQSWLDAVGTDKEQAETKSYIQELEADIMPIDQLIGFAGSEAGAEYFGAETAAGIVAHAEEIKAAGAKYCDCPACAIVAEILEKKAEMLA